jgi:hypothetical protein
MLTIILAISNCGMKLVHVLLYMEYLVTAEQ